MQPGIGGFGEKKIVHDEGYTRLSTPGNPPTFGWNTEHCARNRQRQPTLIADGQPHLYMDPEDQSKNCQPSPVKGSVLRIQEGHRNQSRNRIAVKEDSRKQCPKHTRNDPWRQKESTCKQTAKRSWKIVLKGPYLSAIRDSPFGTDREVDKMIWGEAA